MSFLRGGRNFNYTYRPSRVKAKRTPSLWKGISFSRSFWGRSWSASLPWGEPPSGPDLPWLRMVVILCILEIHSKRFISKWATLWLAVKWVMDASYYNTAFTLTKRRLFLQSSCHDFSFRANTVSGVTKRTVRHIRATSGYFLEMIACICSHKIMYVSSMLLTIYWRIRYLIAY